jgi:hypothetical protein
MSQTGLIDAVTESAHIPKGRLKYTPTSATAILQSDIDGIARQKYWNYSSVIGQLNYLAQNSWPDISFAVHQCARFSKEPNTLHKKAVKRIIYYLQCCTRDKPLIVKPKKNISLDAYCDSDFAGVWHQEFSHLRDLCLSRTGFITVLAGVPIHWLSKLQTEKALSSTEAEYIALSQCCRALLPMRRTLKDIFSCGIFPNSLKVNNLSTNNVTTRKFEHHYHSKNESKLEPSIIWEDNQGCIHLANDPSQNRPRTKHISIKWRHFLDEIQKGNIKITKIHTSLNISVILTKPLVTSKFIGLRKFLMGW